MRLFKTALTALALLIGLSGFQPAARAVTVLAEGFETAFWGAPVGWTRVYMTCESDWFADIGDGRGLGAHGGTYNASFCNQVCEVEQTYLITPPMNLTGITSPVLEFWHQQDGEDDYQNTLAVCYKTSAGGAWVQLANYTSDTPVWTKRVIPLPNPSATYYVGFLGTANWGWALCIDDVLVSEADASAPTVTSITPNSGVNTGSVSIIDLAGTNFRSGATVKLTRFGQADIVASNVTVVNPTQITCTFQLSGAATGAWNVVVTNPDTQFGMLTNGLTVTTSPLTIIGITPSSAPTQTAVYVTVTGTGFESGAMLKLSLTGQSDIVATGVAVMSDTQLTGWFVLASAAVGNWSVAITNPGGQPSAMGNLFTVSAGQGLQAAGNNDLGQLGRGDSLCVKPALVGNVLAIGARGYHNLAVKSDGTVWTWGKNNDGQLGDGTATDRSTPVQALGLTGVLAIAAGGSHSLAVKSDGTVWAWGGNDEGQLGDGTTTSSSTPVQVSGLTGAVAVAAGYYHSLAVKSDGTVWAWGRNWSGQLGDGTTTSRSIPVPVSALTGIAKVAAGYYHSLAIKSDGTLWAWGENGYGELGDGTTTARSSPVQVSGLTGVLAVAAGNDHSLAVKTDGTVWAWGYNYHGQLGDGTTNNSPTVVQVSGLTGAVAISAGYWHSLVVKSDGTAWAWGNNYSGQLGDGTSTNRLTPVQVQQCGETGYLTGAAAVASGDFHCLAFKSGGTVWAWGGNNHGQFGNGVTSLHSTPVLILGLTDVVTTSAGGAHSLAVKNDGSVWAWGSNDTGELGDGTTTSRPLPVEVKGVDGMGFLAGVVAVAAGSYHNLAVRSDGTVWAWGGNNHGQLGIGTTADSPTPVQVKGVGGVGYLTGVVVVATGRYHSLAIKHDGTVWAWGDNYSGQLGQGTTTDSSTPVQVKGNGGSGFLTGVVGIASRINHSLAVNRDGAAWAWGENSTGQLGDGTSANRSTPVQVKDAGGTGYLTGIVRVAAGYGHCLALKNDGTVWAWGDNYYGQLGDTTTTNSPIPVEVRAFEGAGFLTGILAVTAGASSSFAIMPDQTACAWGNNYDGRLGDGTTTNRSAPVRVKGTGGVEYLGPVAGLSAGGGHTLFSTVVNEMIRLVTVGTWPVPDTAETSVSTITVSFSRNVVNVSADDLVLSAGQVLSVSGAGNSYLFSVSGITGQVTATIWGNITDLDGVPLEPYQWVFDLAQDTDGDDVFGLRDNCPDVVNPDQVNTDGDGLGDACDPDDDNDGIDDSFDPSPLDAHACGDTDGDGCDDCSTGRDGFGPLIDRCPLRDGPDGDRDGICDSGDACPNTISGLLVDSTGCTTFGPGDLDLDGDVDVDDILQFEACASGPAVPLQSACCRNADLDSDNDVDQSDFGVIQRCYGGDSQIPPAECGQYSRRNLFISNGTGGGNWNEPSTWRGCVVPGSVNDFDSVQILTGDTVTQNATLPKTLGTYLLEEGATHVFGSEVELACLDVRIHGQWQRTGTQPSLVIVRNALATFASVDVPAEVQYDCPALCELLGRAPSGFAYLGTCPNNACPAEQARPPVTPMWADHDTHPEITAVALESPLCVLQRDRWGHSDWEWETGYNLSAPHGLNIDGQWTQHTFAGWAAQGSTHEDTEWRALNHFLARLYRLQDAKLLGRQSLRSLFCMA